MRGFIYFARMHTGAVKIGFSTDVERRVQSLYYVVPGGVEVLCSINGTPAGEKWVQSKFHHLRISGEWFEASDDLMSFIDKASLAGSAVLPEQFRCDDVQKAARLPQSDEVAERCRFLLMCIAEPVRAGEKIPDLIRRAAARTGIAEMRAKGIWYREARAITAAEYVAITETYDTIYAAEFSRQEMASAGGELRPSRPAYRTVADD
jgi:hypothetical protein